MNEWENLKQLQSKVLMDPVIRWTELSKLDELDRLILLSWESLYLPCSFASWLDLLIERYQKKGVPIYKRKLKWELTRFPQVMKNYYKRKS